MANVAVVTDSAADIPAALAGRHKITVVPLKIRFGEREFVDGTELTTADFWRELQASKDHPATAAPSSGDFEQAYRAALADGADAIVSIHLSSKLSATYQSAVVGAKAIPDARIEVVDSMGVSAMHGLAAVVAAEMAAAGATADEIVERVQSLRARTTLVGTVDTLEYLRRGGRIGGAQAFLGTMLQIKPLVTLAEGIVEPAGRVRTRAKALQHLVDVTPPADALEHVVLLDGAATDVGDYADLMRSKLPAITGEHIWSLGPVVGTHAGPGVLGVVWINKA